MNITGSSQEGLILLLLFFPLFLFFFLFLLFFPGRQQERNHTTTTVKQCCNCVFSGAVSVLLLFVIVTVVDVEEDSWSSSLIDSEMEKTITSLPKPPKATKNLQLYPSYPLKDPWDLFREVSDIKDMSWKCFLNQSKTIGSCTSSWTSMNLPQDPHNTLRGH